MNEVVWIAIGSVVGVIGIVIAWLSYRENHSAAAQAALAETIKGIVKETLEPVVAKQAEATLLLGQMSERQNALDASLKELQGKLGGVLDRVAILDTKVEVFWKNVAMDAAKIIHSPDPRRAHVDALIEDFQHAVRTGTRLSPARDAELRRVLQVFMDWEPGKPSEFPIRDGEQALAAILYHTMEPAMEVSSRGQQRARS
jgi:hypothetical protein